MSKFQRAIDLGCLDLGCLDSQSRGEASNGETAVSRSGKKKNPLQRSKNSPLHWFPRRKGDSYLERKIKKLQEVDGMNLTLDETLEDSNPHYCKILREKMAARESAHKAMEARKAALVEASWCRILKAARIQSREAEEAMVKAEKAAAEAFEAATAIGVIMHDKPDSSRKRCQIETSSGNGNESYPTHTVTASFESAFEVDKEVAAALKIAFGRLSQNPSFSKDEFKELARKISENPDVGDDLSNHEISEVSSECEFESESEFEHSNKTLVSELMQQKRRQSFGKLNKDKLIDMMHERLQHLQEDELSSLVTIVATCGLNAALAEHQQSSITENSGCHLSRRTSTSAMGAAARRYSNFHSFMNGQIMQRKPPAEAELPGLDKFLVKSMTKLEREVQEAKKISRNISEVDDASDDTEVIPGEIVQQENVSDFGNNLLKHSSRLEKEIEEAKKSSGRYDQRRKNEKVSSSEVIPDLGSFLVKKQSRLEKEIEEYKRSNGDTHETAKRNVRMKIAKGADSELPSLDKFLVKHVSKLEKEVQEAKNKRHLVNSVPEEDKSINRNNLNGTGKENMNLNTEVDRVSEVKQFGYRRTPQNRQETDYESLDKVLVKSVSKLEKEKMNFNAKAEGYEFKKEVRKRDSWIDSEGGLDKLLMKKHQSRLEKEKTEAAAVVTAIEEPKEGSRFSSVARRQARERELEEAWGGISLGNSVQPRLSRLEREKAAWIKAEEEERKRPRTEI